MSDALICFDELNVRFGKVRAVSGLSFSVEPGETAAVVGETGSGKSVAMLAALGLLPRTASVTGRVRIAGRELIGLDRRTLDTIRGKTVSIIFQEPQTALDPLCTVGTQIAAVVRFGRGLDRRKAWARAEALLEEVGLPEPTRRARSYPHELSGGQRQRVAIAMAIACEPRLIIADEPTTALDVTVAARILDLLGELKTRHGMALILVSHDLGVVRRVADTIHVMDKGRLVESGPTRSLLRDPREAYTRKLLAAETMAPALPPDPTRKTLLRTEDLNVRYELRNKPFFTKRYFAAVRDANIVIPQGETLGLIGESGSGKSTLGRALVKLVPSFGAIFFDDRDLQALSETTMRPLRRHLQIVFQDPFASLSPRLDIGDIVTEGLAIHEPALGRAQRARRGMDALREVGLPETFASRLPHELSGGQRQRVAIARAIILSPRLVILDEPTSALDRIVQAEVLGLLGRLQKERGLSYVFITHDLAVVRAMAPSIAVMKDGKIIETGPTERIMSQPAHAYTAALVKAAMLVYPPDHGRPAATEDGDQR